jgi:hypothetical protein
MSRWLHNMSVAPRTVVSRSATSDQQFCLKVLFRLSSEGRITPGALLRTVEPGWGGPRPAAELRRRITVRARELNLPPAAAVAPGGLPDETCQDVLTICTVLAKSSGAVYLRDKEPNLERLTNGASVLLLIPKTWRFNA